MDLIKQSQAEVFHNRSVTSWEYTTKSAKMNVARIRIDGRYPAEGFVSNREVDAIVHVISGHGVIGLKGDLPADLTKHDQVHLATGDQYFFDGVMEILYSATPKWTPAQTDYSL